VELKTKIRSAGSTTLKRKPITKGIEPDTCYYIQNEPLIRGKPKLDFTTDPAPNLAVEIDLTSSYINKLNIYAALGVGELWRYDGEFLKFYQLVASEYIEIKSSIAFPLISVSEMNRFIQQSKTMDEIHLVQSFRAWVQGKIG
jgi:Uma2 family endonuclease